MLNEERGIREKERVGDKELKEAVGDIPGKEEGRWKTQEKNQSYDYSGVRVRVCTNELRVCVMWLCFQAQYTVGRVCEWSSVSLHFNYTMLWSTEEVQTLLKAYLSLSANARFWKSVYLIHSFEEVKVWCYHYTHCLIYTNVLTNIILIFPQANVIKVMKTHFTIMIQLSKSFQP